MTHYMYSLHFIWRRLFRSFKHFISNMFKVNLKTLTLAATMKTELVASRWYTLLFKFDSDFSVQIFTVISRKKPVSRLKTLFDQNNN